ncbi:hypothetical protein [Brevibacillus borstelensis]|uniref:hypothetical protein n=1 Tax=Brevibacillus borstelensis TaxID=45462 RepID=UPI0030BE64DC
MKKKMITFGSIIMVVILAILAINLAPGVKTKKELREYLQITATAYNNGKNDDDGVSLVLYLYSIQNQKMSEFFKIPIDPGYPLLLRIFGTIKCILAIALQETRLITCMNTILKQKKEIN